MSRGPGRIERAIRELFDAHPALAFVTDELIEHCYPDAERVSDEPKLRAAIQARHGLFRGRMMSAMDQRYPRGALEFPRKYQVAVLRATHNVIDSDPDWRAWRIEGQGRGWVFFNHANVQSYALARLISDQFYVYRSEKRHRRGGILSGLGFVPDRAKLLALLADERLHYRDYVAPGGLWSCYVQRHCAKRDGDAELAAAITARVDADRAAWAAGWRKRFSATNVPRNETLIAKLAEIAKALRAVAVENDPDAIRAGLVEIANALDAMHAG